MENFVRGSVCLRLSRFTPPTPLPVIVHYNDTVSVKALSIYARAGVCVCAGTSRGRADGYTQRSRLPPVKVTDNLPLIGQTPDYQAFNSVSL